MKKITQIIVLITTFFVSINSFAGVSSIDGYKDITFGMSIDEGYEILKKCKDEGGCKQSITLLSDGTANVTGISVDYGRYNKHMFNKLLKAISTKYNKNFTPNRCDKNKYIEPINTQEISRKVLSMFFSNQFSNNIYVKDIGNGFANNQVWLLRGEKINIEAAVRLKNNPELWSTDEHIIVEYSEKNGIGQKRYEKLMDSQCHQELDV